MVVVFFDIKGAYDTTWQYGILEKVYKHGFRGNLPVFIESFLKNRCFHVKLGNILSTRRTLENGVAQGSTLSCSLFGIAINDIADNIDSSILPLLYVDDLAIALSGTDMVSITVKLQEAINPIVANGLSVVFRFSTEKTSCVHFCRKTKLHPDPVLTMNGVALACSDMSKFLGLTFDKKLT